MAQLSDVTSILPVPSFTAASIVGFVAWIIIFVIFCIVTMIVTIVIIQRVRYNKVIVIFTEINGRFEVTKKDRARLHNLGKTGDRIFYLKKLKKFQPMPSLQMGRNVYWFFLREDDELINFDLANLNLLSREMGAHFLDKEMRYARTQLQGIMKERYAAPKFLERYGTVIISIAVLALLLTFIWLIMDKVIDAIGEVGTVVKIAGETNKETARLVNALANLKNGGSGLVPAT